MSQYKFSIIIKAITNNPHYGLNQLCGTRTYLPCAEPGLARHFFLRCVFLAMWFMSRWKTALCPISYSKLLHPIILYKAFSHACPYSPNVPLKDLVLLLANSLYNHILIWNFANGHFWTGILLFIFLSNLWHPLFRKAIWP